MIIDGLLLDEMFPRLDARGQSIQSEVAGSHARIRRRRDGIPRFAHFSAASAATHAHREIGIQTLGPTREFREKARESLRGRRVNRRHHFRPRHFFQGSGRITIARIRGSGGLVVISSV